MKMVGWRVGEHAEITLYVLHYNFSFTIITTSGAPFTATKKAIGAQRAQLIE